MTTGCDQLKVEAPSHLKLTHVDAAASEVTILGPEEDGLAESVRSALVEALERGDSKNPGKPTRFKADFKVSSSTRAGMWLHALPVLGTLIVLATGLNDEECQSTVTLIIDIDGKRYRAEETATAGTSISRGHLRCPSQALERALSKLEPVDATGRP